MLTKENVQMPTDPGPRCIFRVRHSIAVYVVLSLLQTRIQISTAVRVTMRQYYYTEHASAAMRAYPPTRPRRNISRTPMKLCFGPRGGWEQGTRSPSPPCPPLKCNTNSYQTDRILNPIQNEAALEVRYSPVMCLWGVAYDPRTPLIRRCKKNKM